MLKTEKGRLLIIQIPNVDNIRINKFKKSQEIYYFLYFLLLFAINFTFHPKSNILSNVDYVIIIH